MLRLSQKFPGKRAFVTGAGSGLGAALCRLLAADGWTIAMSDVRQEPLEAVAQEITALGGTPWTYVLDVTDRATYARVVETFLARAGGVDLVVNNAGVAGGGLVGEYTLEDWDWLMRINFMGPVHGCHFFVPHLKKQQSGHIINVASAAALFAVPRMAAYCSAKAGVKMLSEVLHNELEPSGVGVSVAMPEYFRTNLHEGARGPEKERAKRMIQRAPYSAEQVARVVLDDAGAGELYIVFPRRAQILWWLNRVAPRAMASLLRAGARRTVAKVPN